MSSPPTQCPFPAEGAAPAPTREWMEEGGGGKESRLAVQRLGSGQTLWSSPPALLLSGLLASSRRPAPQPQAPHPHPGTFQRQLEGGGLNGEFVMENSMAGPYTATQKLLWPAGPPLGVFAPESIDHGD